MQLFLYDGFNINYARTQTPKVLSPPNSALADRGEHVVSTPGTYVLRFTNQSASATSFRYRLFE